MSFSPPLPGMNLFLDVSKDGNLVTAVEYSNKESVGVSILIATSCLSLVAVLGLLVLMGVSILVSARLGVHVYTIIVGCCVVQ